MGSPGSRFRRRRTTVSDCYGVLVTHVHPDHHGLSERLREASNAWVALHEATQRW